MAKGKKKFRKPAKADKAPPPEEVEQGGQPGQPAAAGPGEAPASDGPMTDEMRMKSRYSGM